MLIIIFLENVHYHLFQTTYLPVTNVETYRFKDTQFNLTNCFILFQCKS